MPEAKLIAEKLREMIADASPLSMEPYTLDESRVSNVAWGE